MNEKKVMREIMATTGITYDEAHRIFNPTIYDYLIDIKLKIVKWIKLRKKLDNGYVMI